VDLLYHEATFLTPEEQLAKKTLHSTAAQAAEIAVKAHARNLIIGHFSVRYKKTEAFAEEAGTIFPGVQLAMDGDTYVLEPGGGLVLHRAGQREDTPGKEEEE
jgi:ribonuclease Z